MKVKELILELQKIEDEFGNLEVYTEHESFENPTPIAHVEVWIDPTPKKRKTRKPKPRLVFIINKNTA